MLYLLQCTLLPQPESTSPLSSKQGTGTERPKSLNSHLSPSSDIGSLRRTESCGAFPIKLNSTTVDEIGFNVSDVSIKDLYESNDVKKVGNSMEDENSGKEKDRDRVREKESREGRERGERGGVQGSDVAELESVGVTTGSRSGSGMTASTVIGGGGGGVQGDACVFRLSESMALVHAREILALSNRYITSLLSCRVLPCLLLCCLVFCLYVTCVCFISSVYILYHYYLISLQFSYCFYRLFISVILTFLFFLFFLLFLFFLCHLFILQISFYFILFYFHNYSLFHFNLLTIIIIRTQSGGDTYFCIDTLLRDTEQDFSILTPLGRLGLMLNITYCTIIVVDVVVVFVYYDYYNYDYCCCCCYNYNYQYPYSLLIFFLINNITTTTIL